jgi:NADH dehydrogenase [ubiquinone] 1 alpha subcomplex assembly factor 5
MERAHEIFDRELMARRRDRFAAAATEHDFLLERVADDLVQRLSFIRRRFPVAVNLGAYHGVVGRRLRASGAADMVIDVELSKRLLEQGTGPRVRADEERLPFRAASLDLVVSGLALHLVNDLPGALAQIRRALKPDGLLLAALLGGRTLHELREAFVLAEAEHDAGSSPHVAPFADVRDLGGLLQRAQLALPVADSDTVVVHYSDPFALMRELQAMGASNMLRERRRQPMPRRTLMRMAQVYAERHARSDGRIPATFEIVTVTGWAPHESQQQPLQPGSSRQRLADALGTVERPVGKKVPR